MKNWIPLTEAAELIDVDYHILYKVYERKNIQSRDRSNAIEVNVNSLLEYYPEKRQTFMRNLVDRGDFRYKKSESYQRSYQSIIDAGKVMTKEAILHAIMPEFASASVKDQIEIATRWQAEFPDCRGISVQNLRGLKSRYLKLGDIGLERKSRTDMGAMRTSKWEAVRADFDGKFRKMLASQGWGKKNNYENTVVAKAWRLALYQMCKERGHKLQNYKNYDALQKLASEILANEAPSIHYAYKIAYKDGHVKLGRKLRLNRPDFEQNAMPLHFFDYWKQYQFFENIQSDGHKFDEKILLWNEDKKIFEERTVYGLVWIEAKTRMILRFDLQLNSWNSRRVSISMMKLIDQYGRPESWRFDNGKEYINQQILQSILSLYDPSELNEKLRISQAQAYKGRQKIPEKVFSRFNEFLRDSKGYSGSDRINGPKPTIGTAPVKACRTLEEYAEVVRDIVDAFNHEFIEVRLEESTLKDIDLIRPEFEKPRLTKRGTIEARRIDLFNAMMEKHVKTIIPKDYLTMSFGLREEATIRNSGIFKTFMDERFFYLPSREDTLILNEYYGRPVEVRYDPDNEYTMQHLFVFDKDTQKYITTVYCDLLRNYHKEQGEEYKKRKRELLKMFRKFNEDFAYVDVLAINLEMHLQNRTVVNNESKTKIIKWNEQISHFSENRNREEEILREMAESREEAIDIDMDVEYDEDVKMWVNRSTAELFDYDPRVSN